MSNSTKKIITGPRGWPLSGNLYHLKNDILKKLQDDRARFGSIMKYRIGYYKYIVINSPEYIRHVLLEQKSNYSKQTLSNEQSKHITGESLLTLHGDDWHKQRRRMQGAFRKNAVANYYKDMNVATDTFLQHCQNHQGPINITHAMTNLTYTIVGKALFGAKLQDSQEQIRESLDIALHYIHGRIESLIRLPLWGYTRKQRRFKQAIQQFDNIVNSIIEQRHASNDENDLLQKLLISVDEKDQSRMTQQQLRNEIVTLLLAGHETTANLMTWCLYELASKPDIQEKLYEEVKDIDFSTITAKQLGSLEYTFRIIQESMRLYPPVWLMERHTINKDEINGYTIPKNTTIIISPWVMHRHPEYWAYPNEFNIDNFLPENFEKIPDYVFIPFGKGPRMCIGMNFAIQEAIIILAKIGQQFILDQASPANVTPDPSITLRPVKNMQVRFTAREKNVSHET
ncbi:hypothetical protein MNBD_GAMMA12-2399 [hydrothermal vent metagenome]|uniref:Cytochrome P450 n=1 Tax=hydrothermal vent metagenome TaxID=652676 RepID=A0A3B0YZV9_9ZZZZ